MDKDHIAPGLKYLVRRIILRINKLPAVLRSLPSFPSLLLRRHGEPPGVSRLVYFVCHGELSYQSGLAVFVYDVEETNVRNFSVAHHALRSAERTEASISSEIG
jgi:hypothetical protein